MQSCSRRLLCASRTAYRPPHALPGAVRGTLRCRQLAMASTPSEPARDPAPKPPSPPPAPTPSADSPPNSALLLFCLSTGLVDSLTFAVSGVWCAFVTGTTVQLGMDLPSLFTELGIIKSSTSWPTAVTYFTNSSTAERAAALGGFVFGGFLGPRLPRWVTPARSSALRRANGRAKVEFWVLRTTVSDRGIDTPAEDQTTRGSSNGELFVVDVGHC